MTPPFTTEFQSDPTILRAALEAAVGPLPDVEVLPTGWIRVAGRLNAPDAELALQNAREALAVYVAAWTIVRACSTCRPPTTPQPGGEPCPIGAAGQTCLRALDHDGPHQYQESLF
jgi:hypothetical protein